KALLDGGALQMSLFDDRDMAGITSPEFPGERLIVCRNRALASERARKREDLLAATERDLARIAAAVARKRQPLRGKAELGLDLQIRPVYHWLADRVRAHVFVCMLAYYLEWHMRQRLAPMLYDDTDKQAAEAQRSSVVAKAERSPAAVNKQTTGRTDDGLPVHSFR